MGTNNTLTVRFEDRFGSRDNAGLGGTKLPPGFQTSPLIPPSQFAYNTNNSNQNLMVTETNVITPKIVNETRFQFTRSHSISNGNEIPTINVAGEFSTGGNGVGDTHDTPSTSNCRIILRFRTVSTPSALACVCAAKATRATSPRVSTDRLPSWAEMCRC